MAGPGRFCGARRCNWVSRTARPQHPAPYWWPNPATPDGLPYVWRDGERVPGSELFSPESERYDRTRLQRLFDDGTVAALAFRTTGEPRYAVHVADLVRRWFLDPATRMTPHMQYAQWRPEDSGRISGFGIIEMKDLYFFLDAVRLVRPAGMLTASEETALRDWLASYLQWILTSPQGQAERRARNNHGTCFDLQVAALAAFLGEMAVLSQTLRAAKARLATQFAADGSQPEELSRTQTAHYTTFNLQCWINLARLTQTVGCALWQYGGTPGGALPAGLSWLLPRLEQDAWPHAQSEPFERTRRLPLAATATDRYGEMAFSAMAGNGLRLEDWPVVFFPHDGVKPFWLIDHLTGCAAPALVSRAPPRDRRRGDGRKKRRH